ncbi:MAG: cytochrome-c oxidase, cbb3-type subunit II [Gemmatimonadaceae bacterium]
MYWVRVVGGLFVLTGALIFAYNIFKTYRQRVRPPSAYEIPVIQAPALPKAVPLAGTPAPAGGFFSFGWHRKYEGLPILFTVLTTLAVIIASLFEILPTFLIKSNIPTIASVKPYTPLELAGRDIYIREGCFNCHSQMIRPFRWETERYGDYSKPGESVYDHPFLWGSRRTGPDLAREGGKYNDLWHLRHFENPRSISPKSIMPTYAQLLTQSLDFNQIQHRVDVMAMLGVPYGDAVTNGAQMAKDQASSVASALQQQGGPAGLQDKEMVALIAYIQRLGQDIKNAPVAGNTATPSGAATPGSHP